jgi:cytochrome c-type biogenesis protein CcmH/NrfG
MAGPHPINNGTGLGTFDLVYPQYSEVGYTKLAHNSYLQLASEAGSLTAGVLLVLLGASVLPAAVRLAKGRTGGTAPEDPSWVPDDRLMLSGLLGGASASVARNLVDSDWYVTAIGITFWAVLGAALRLGRPEQPRAVRMRAGWAALAILVLAIFLAGVLVALASDVYAERGNSLLADGDPVAALDAFRPAARLDPLNATNLRGMASAYIMLALGFEDSSYSEQAERALKKAVSLEPTNPRTYYQLGRAYELYPRYEDAIEAFRQASERDPHSPQIMLALGRRYEAAGKKKETLAVWRRMVEVEESPYERVKAMPEVVEPAYIFAHAALGAEFERLGKRNAAVREYRLAMDRIRRYEDSMKAMGAVLEAAGRRDHAMESEVRSTKMRLVQRLRQLESQPAP